MTACSHCGGEIVFGQSYLPVRVPGRDGREEGDYLYFHNEDYDSCREVAIRNEQQKEIKPENRLAA